MAAESPPSTSTPAAGGEKPDYAALNKARRASIQQKMIVPLIYGPLLPLSACHPGLPIASFQLNSSIFEWLPGHEGLVIVPFAAPQRRCLVPVTSPETTQRCLE